MMRERLRILFLCTEPAGYLVNCIQTLSREFETQVRVVHWPVSASAPFEIQTDGIEAMNTASVTRDKLIDFSIGFSPALVFVAGWVDKEYLNIAKQLRKQGAIVVCGLDNPWKGTLRQRMLVLLSPLKIKPYFDRFWVAGNAQRQFAHRMGYDDSQIIDTLYVADISRFLNPGKSRYTKTLVFAGRLELTKGIDLLYHAFTQLPGESRNGWTLHIIGNGSLASSLAPHPAIRRDDFMQPDVLFENTRDAGGFILPSRDEHWGVVVQEFAAAGLPLLLSDEVHSGEAFLEEGINGFSFKSNSVEAIQQTLKKFFQLSEEELTTMGKRSTELALHSSPSLWAQKLLSVIPGYKRNSVTA